MGTNKKSEALLDAIAVPFSVSEKQAHIAKKLVAERVLGDFNVQDFCKNNALSTKTYYVWFENEGFASYVNQLQDAVIPADEREAYQKIKKHILKIADKPNPSLKEIEVFTSTFQYVVDADQRERAEALGLSENKKPLSAQSLDDKKSLLLSRLKG